MRKTVLNKENQDTTKEPLFLGKDLSLQRFDRLKYPEFEKLIKQQLEFFWTPFEISLVKDRNDFKNLAENEQFIFTKNLQFQTLMDSVIARGIPEVSDYVSNPELEACMSVWQFFETLHSYAYTYIIQNVYANPSQILDEALEDKEILARCDSVSKEYDKLKNPDRDIKEQIYLTLISINILEAVRFYVSFVCAFWFGDQKKMIGNADIVKLIRRDECVSGDTELFTEKGWVRICEISMDDKVLQYSKDGSANYEYPIGISTHITNKSYHYYNSRRNNVIDMVCSENHRMIFRKGGNIKEQFAKDFSHTCDKSIIHAAKKVGSINSLTGHQRFLIAYQADGAKLRKLDNGKISGFIRVNFKIKKQRKIDRLVELANLCGYKYTVSKKNDRDQAVVTIKVPKDLIITKEFSDWISLKEVNYEWCQEFIQEVEKWDGWIDGESRCGYGSVNKSNIDIVQTIASFAGYRTSISKIPDDRKESYSDYYKLHIIKHRDNSNCGANTLKVEINKDRITLYGIEVPSGMLMCRRNNTIFVTGNSKHLSITQAILNILQKEESEGFQKTIKKCETEAIELFKHAVDEEKAWCDYLFSKGPLLGLNSEIMHEYIEWLADSRMKAIGLPTQYNVKRSPIGGWASSWFSSGSVQVAPQESEITSYKISASKNDLDDMDFSDL